MEHSVIDPHFFKPEENLGQKQIVYCLCLSVLLFIMYRVFRSSFMYSASMHMYLMYHLFIDHATCLSWSF